MIDEFYRKIGKRIKTLREEKGWSQAELLKKLHEIHAANFNDVNIISRIENGTRYGNNRYLVTNSQLETFIEIFHVDKGYLIYGDDAEQKELIDFCFKELEPREDRKKEILHDISRRNGINLKEVYESAKEEVLQACKKHVFSKRTLREIDDTFVDKVGKEIIFYIEGELLSRITQTVAEKMETNIKSEMMEKEQLIEYSSLLLSKINDICVLIKKEIDKKTSRKSANIIQKKLIEEIDKMSTKLNLN